MEWRKKNNEKYTQQFHCSLCEQCTIVCVCVSFLPPNYIQLLYYNFRYKIFRFLSLPLVHLYVCLFIFSVHNNDDDGNNNIHIGLAPAAMHTFQRILEQNVSNKLAITGICKSMRKLGQWSRLHLLMSR